jgi:iron(III) transport system permease protein
MHQAFGQRRSYSCAKGICGCETGLRYDVGAVAANATLERGAFWRSSARKVTSLRPSPGQERAKQKGVPAALLRVFYRSWDRKMVGRYNLIAAVTLLAILLASVFLAAAGDRVRSLLGNTLLLAAAVAAVSVPLAAGLAMAIVKTDLPGRRWAGLALGVPLLVPLYLQAAAWQAGFGIQGWWTLHTGGIPWVDGWTGAIWVHAMAAIPWAALIVGIGLWQVERPLEEQALLDGSPRQVFLRVTLRRAAAPAVIAALWVAVTTAGEMTVTDLMQIRTFAEEVYTDYAATGRLGDGPPPFWIGVGLTGLLVIAGLAACAGLAPHLREPSRGGPWRQTLRGWRWPTAGGVLLGCFVLLGVPLMSLVIKAGMGVAHAGGQPVRCWSAFRCLAMVAGSPARHAREFGWSIVIATAAAVAVMVIATMLAWLARERGTGRIPLLVVTALALAVPGPVVGVAIIQLLNHPHVPALMWLYDRSILAPWLAQTFRGLPLPTLIMWHALATVPAGVLESASTAGAGGLTRLVWIALPLRWPALVAAGLVAWITAFGELAATILVIPPGMPTLPIRTFGLLHYGVEDELAGICLALAAMIAGVAAAPMALAAPQRGPTG